MKVKKILLRKNWRLRWITLSGIIISILSGVLYKNPTLFIKDKLINNTQSYAPTSSNKPALSANTSVDSSSWKEHQSEWATNVGITGEDPYITHYLVFSVTSKLPDGWAIGDNSYYYNNDQTTWKWVEGSHIRPGLVPSQYVKIERVTITNNPDTDKIYHEEKITRVAMDGLVALVSSNSKGGIEVEIIKSLQIKLKSSKCINRKTNALNYDCSISSNIPLGDY